MSEIELEADYLVVGSGAVGMAFADILLTESDATIIMVDKYPAPGGHWNVAYPFVRLHQPSSFYGVSSKELSKGRKDSFGLNQGLGELASGAEVLSYFDEVMRHQFLPSGRLQYFPMCEYLGEGRFRSMASGQEFCVSVRRKTVDATWLKTTVPSTHTPSFSIAEGIRFMPLNDLPTVTEAPDGYTVIGGGKTGIDACLWLLENHVAPERIRWIMPRDGWLLDRKNTQSTEEFFANSIGANAAQMEAIVAADSIPDLFDRLEAAGVLLRIDRGVRPKMFHGATISQGELEELRRIKNIVRLGRVQRIESDRIVLEEGEIPTDANTLHVDCSARAITNEATTPVFDGNLITPQMVRSYQPVFSAAFIAHVELAYEDDEKKNSFCGIVPLPNHDTDWIRMFSAFMVNQYIWSQEPGLKEWLLHNRLDGFSEMMASVSPDDEEKQAIMRRMSKSAFPAVEKLQELMAQIPDAA